MIKAIKIGICIYLAIMISYATGINHQTTDADLSLPETNEPIIPLVDTARHYKQIFTRPNLKKLDVKIE